MSCLFCKIINKEIPAQIVYEDQNVLAFKDISPQAPVHLLVIPKKHIASINEAGVEDEQLIGKMILAAQKLAKEAGVAEGGYRIVLNCNEDGGQTVFHIHLHLLGGRSMQWPPG